MKLERRCAKCNKPLNLSEVAANYNDEWFACLPCWDASEGFIGWRVSTGSIPDTERDD